MGSPGVPSYLTNPAFLSGWTRESQESHPADWSPADAAAMSWRLALPMLSLFLREDWEPSGEAVVRWGRFQPKYESLASTLVGANWILVSLFLLSISGLMKTRQ